MAVITASKDRLHQKNELFVKLGKLFGPLQRLIETPDNFDDQEKAETIARYSAEWSNLAQQFHTFSAGQPGHDYQVEYMKFHNSLQGVILGLYGERPLEEILPKQYAIALSSIDAIPIPRTSLILEAGSPFTAYCKLRELCESDATKNLIWLDPYFDASIFHRYLSIIRENVPVTLVTSETKTSSGKKDRDRFEAFLDVSRLYASEHGSDKYHLIIQPDLHDRWIVFNDKRIYALGGSAKDAAAKDYFTITSVEATEFNLNSIKNHIETGTEWFGTSLHTHR